MCHNGTVNNMNYEELIVEIEELRKTYNAFAIAIDGMECAGKTTLAAHLSQKYGAPIIHMSDFLLPVKERPDGWEKQSGQEMDFERFCEEISQPWLAKKPLVYTLTDPESGELRERVALPDAQMYIIEGTYALHPAIMDFYDLRIFMKIDAADQKARAEKEKRALPQNLLDRQNKYFLMYMTELLADAVTDETLTLPEKESKPSQSMENLAE